MTPHGCHCLGCWSLMLLMFANGMSKLGWMLLLGATMAAEENLPSGRKFSPALGLALLALGTLVLLGGPGHGTLAAASHRH